MDTRMKKILAGLAAGAAMAVLFACLLPAGDGVCLNTDGNDTCGTITAPPDTNLAFVYNNAIKPAKCSNCHASTTHESGISFASLPATYTAFFKPDTSPQLTKELQTTAPIYRVQPGSLEGSYLWHKIDPTGHPTPKNGTKMPPPANAGSVLTADHIAIIRAWIVRGAPVQ
jgi:hypothetical protein